MSKAEYQKRYKDKRRDQRRSLMAELLGDFCFTCKNSPDLMIAHRKDGSAHPKFSDQTVTWIREALESGEYVRLCPICHKGVHWAMQFLGMDWDEIHAALVQG